MEEAKKWFNRFKLIPKITLWTIIGLYFVWSIVDVGVFSSSSYSYYSYSKYYGVFQLKSWFLSMLIWNAIGVVVALVSYCILKLSISYKVLHIEYLEKISSKVDTITFNTLSKTPEGTFDNTQRLKIFRRDNGICKKCGKKCEWNDCVEDYIIPLSLGGKNDIENGQILCNSCYSQKSEEK